MKTLLLNLIQMVSVEVILQAILTKFYQDSSPQAQAVADAVIDYIVEKGSSRSRGWLFRFIPTLATNDFELTET